MAEDNTIEVLNDCESTQVQALIDEHNKMVAYLLALNIDMPGGMPPFPSKIKTVRTI
jgi:hypothetical protein